MRLDMTKKTLIALLVLTITAVLVTSGCSRDPNVRKQKYFASGKKYYAKGKYREAAIQFSNALRIDSKFADAHYQLALCDLKLGSAQNAYIELSRTVALQPDNVQAELDLGNLLLVGRAPDKAMERADYVLSKDPNNVDAHILKASADARMRQMDQALTEVNAAIQLDPNRSSSYLDLGALEEAKETTSANAEADFKKAIALDNKAIPPRLALAVFYDRNKRFADADQQLHDALSIAPKDQRVRAGLVRHYLIQGQKQAAEQAAKDAKAVLASDPAGVQFLARYYLLVNDPKSATAEYQNLAQKFPKERQIQHAYLDLLMLQHENDAAMKQVNAILKNFSKDSSALTDKGILLLSQGKPAEARDTLQSVVKAEPQNVVAHFMLGDSYKALGDTNQAQAEWHEAARIQPTYLPAQRGLAQLAIEKRDFTALAEIAKTVQQKLPNAADGYQMQAEVDAANNNAKSAEENLEKAILLNPKDSRFYVQLGQLRMALHRNEEAEKNFEQALQVDPQQTLALSALVQLYMLEKQPQKAVSKAQEMTAQFPQNGPAHLILGELAASQQNLDVAESELSKAVQLMPANVNAYATLASIQMARKEIAPARTTYETAVRNNPSDSGAYLLLGSWQEQQGDAEDAEKNYRKALQLKPDSAPAANNLAYLLTQNGGDIDEAITFAELARRELPNAPSVADTLGWAYYQKGTSSLAVTMLQDAVKAMPNNATYHYHLGMAYSKSGNTIQAKSELQKAMQLEKDEEKKIAIRKGLADLS